MNTEKKHTTIEGTNDSAADIQEQARLALAEDKTQDSSDLLLDVTHLRMDQIKMNLEDLDAEVTVRVELSDQVHIDVTANVQFDNVNIDMKNVEISAQVKVNLKKISEIIDRVLKSIEENPESVSIPVNMGNELSVNISLYKSTEKIIEGESRIKKD